MNLIAFTYTSGTTGFVCVEALKAFQKKDAALQTALRLQTSPIPDRKGYNAASYDAADRQASLDKAFRQILAANRLIKRKGWSLFNKDYVDMLVRENRAVVIA